MYIITGASSSYRLSSVARLCDCAKIGSTQSVPLPTPETDINPFFPGREKMAKYDKDPIFKSFAISQEYEIKWSKSLGSGISGPVRLCIHKETGEEYALKILLDRPKARKEVTLHWLCSGCEYVVKAVDVFANEVQLPGESFPKKRVLLVMELMKGGELFEYITKKQHFTESEASDILRQISLAVEYCHRRNIAHRDLKPENLLLQRRAEVPDDVKVKLADFGFAKIDNGDLTTPQFTPYYVAPQVLEAQKRQKEIRTGVRSPGSPYFYDKSCDMWSIGVILYIMLCGYPPFYSEIPNQPITHKMRKRIMNGDFDFPANEWQNISDEVKDIIRKLLCVEESERITVLDMLQHSWLVSKNISQHSLPSPRILHNKEALDQAIALHSEYLQDMRREDDGFYLKPIGKSKNKLLTSRMKATDAKTDTPVREEDTYAEGRRQSVDDGVRTLRELMDICIMHPPLLNPAATKLADSTLIEGVKRALTFNEKHLGLQNALATESWNGRGFDNGVDRPRLAENLKLVIESTPDILHNE